MLRTPIILVALAIASPAFAQSAPPVGTDAQTEFVGDAAQGEKEFRKCKACHMIRDDAGTDIVRGGRTGPNLYNVVGRKAGTQKDFRYSDALIRLGESGEVWNPADLYHYVTDPNSYVQDRTGDPSLKTKMTFRLKKRQADLVAYLLQNSPAAQEN